MKEAIKIGAEKEILNWLNNYQGPIILYFK